ncbi:DUF805 domain-containing protein [Algimonas porphyrae]|uniref:DUF805 domain-containing protein n=1 Tax=Algimonas porphyrae TaxID=1128113 RepID=A0ABQ5V5U7_9PROT|nr:DUF805 domain-containing protein [Algimonas porphyrae]GLQ22079.1 hypothetical protein GCM10007854_30340 [Algimonas porphyrae]
MGNLLFSPSGRIGPSAYMKGMIVLAVISAIISLIPMFSPSLGMILGFVSLILIIPFIFLGIKRSHDAGKSGWMVLTHILLYIGVAVALGFLLQAIGMGPSAEAEAAIEAASESADLGEVMRLSGELAQDQALPSAVASLVGTLVSAFLVNMFNKQDPGDNQYGPVPAA